jgi:hypothetical protein
MITFFTTGKPFRRHDGVIQRNALKSWTLLHPDVEIILFGDEEGAAEVCAELGLHHEPHVERNGKLPYVRSMFARAQEIAKHEYLCYANCDIILFKDFLKAFETVREWRKIFLGVGRRWDVDVTEAVDFHSASWDQDLRMLTRSRGLQQDYFWIDFFLFKKGLYEAMPPLIVGYCYWDNWMIWKALSLTAPVIDFSAATMAVHQNHEYNAQSGRIKGAATDALSIRNLEAAGGKRHVRSIKAATHRLSRTGHVRQNLRRYLPFLPVWMQRVRRFLTYDVRLPCWHFALRVTRPLRGALKLRSNRIEKPQP